MNQALKKAIGSVLFGAIAVGAGYVATGLVANVRHANAQAEVVSARQQLATVADMATAFKAVGKAVEPSVVSIQVTKHVKVGNGPNLRGLPPGQDDLIRKFFDQDGDGQPDINIPQQGDSEEIGTGSGVIVDTDGTYGYIVTNNHVAGGAEELVITLADGRSIKKAKVIGTDAKSDLAVVRIEASNLITAPWGDSDSLTKGDIIFAFGSPFGYVGSMTHGIVSALNRTSDPRGGNSLLGPFGQENFIQVDAPINPGNSGGPLVSLKGEVVGINTAIISRTGSFNGIGFAIPSNQAKEIYKQLKQSGKVVRGYLGVEIGDVSKQPDLAKSFNYKEEVGVLVNSVTDESPAAGKLRRGDIVTSINGKKTDTVNQLRNIIMGTQPGQEVTLNVFRDEKNVEIKLTVGEQPDSIASIRGKRGTASEDSARGDISADKLGLKLRTPNAAQLETLGITEATKGALVNAVDPRSLAAKAGLVQGDLIIEIGKTSISNAKDAEEALASEDLAKGIRLYVVNPQGSRFVFIQSAK